MQIGLGPDSPLAAFIYKVAKKAHPIATSLPEAFQNTSHRPDDPILSLSIWTGTRQQLQDRKMFGSFTYQTARGCRLRIMPSL
jgi:hypothetical protein